MNNIEIKAKIVDAIKYAKGQLGFNLIEESWGNKQNKTACALGCVLVANNRDISDFDSKNGKEAAQILGVDIFWVNNFIRGFDDSNEECLSKDLHAYELGKEIHNLFLK